ncbi:type II CRISPR RNA-guided endonuclease Cas9 [Penaeicola halotolerans]|uniref:type II CRISPR RNA-guided endonuclease Cas9 n=1 Tax=Penaeicola halotolerans TaxID=2793196 RepID=UPI001CF8109C|nr:type II CRISPR RNA-guided endonuclease Cas9 [Penaeicola halotolerans]
MKKILGLDLGTNSIGWALVEATEDNIPVKIVAMGSRIVPLNSEERDEFIKGNSISKNQKRTLARTQRKGYDRRQIRKHKLRRILSNLNIEPTEDLMKLPKSELWQLRSDATNPNKEITPKQLGRILYHINQKRGYKSARSESNMDKKNTDYVEEVKSRHVLLRENNKTFGNYVSDEINVALKTDTYFRKKDKVFPREAYIEEFEKIINVQKEKHKFLTDEVISKIKDEVIFYQRPLKSQKGLVSICEFEGFERIIKKNGKDKTVTVGSRVAPKSSPLNQLCKIWESTNNINLKVKNPDGSKYKWSEFIPSLDQKERIAEYLFNNEILSFDSLLDILELKKSDVYVNKQILKGIQGNITLSEIKKYLNDDSPLLKFEVRVISQEAQAYLIDKSTGEVIEERDAFILENSIQNEPLYRLWHTIYSIKNPDECENALIKKFNLERDIAANLSRLDFNKYAFANKSHKAIRKILPYLMQGFNYADACSLAGYNHSDSLTKQENDVRNLKEKLELIPKSGLRQPVVEKVLNQMINLVNSAIDEYGKPDSIRVELARELKQSKDERNDSDRQNTINKRLHEEISKRLYELGIPATKKYIQKYKFIFPIREKKYSDAQVNTQCIYCGQNFNISEALSGANFDIDHIVPKALLFDDSQLNKVLVHSECNKNKTNRTAYDYIASKGEVELSSYLNRVDDWYKRNIISYGKMLRLKVSHKEYLERKKANKETESDKRLWENFINRSLRETAYISRKASEILKQICRNVSTTDGSITAKLRDLWGWDDVLMNLQLPKYRELNQVEWKEWTSNHGKNKHKKEVIKNWDKRDDHRHHAIDALVVACTRQGFIQRINTLNADDTKDEMRRIIEASKQEQGERYNEKILFETNTLISGRQNKLTELDQYLISQRPNSFTTQYVMREADKILVSFKAGKRVATISRFKALGENKGKGVITPRGSLHEQFVYGKIKQLEKDKPIKFLVENSDSIVDGVVKGLVKDRLVRFDNDFKKALNSLKKNPIYLDDKKTKLLEKAHCFKEEVVLKYRVQDLKKKDVEFIIDRVVKERIQNRLDKYNGNEKEAFKETVWFNEDKQIPILSVRLRTGLTAIEAVKKDENGKEIGFSKTGNNHHIAIYKDTEGKFIEHLSTFWHAVERKKYGVPYIISSTHEIWNELLKKELPQSFLSKLPLDNLKLVHSLQQNEMFVLGISNEEFENALSNNDYGFISKYLYLVWSIGQNDYWFRHHLETKNSELKKIEGAKESLRFFRFKSIGSFLNKNPIKVRVNNIGQLVKLSDQVNDQSINVQEPQAPYTLKSINRHTSHIAMEDAQREYAANQTPESRLEELKRLNMMGFGLSNEPSLDKLDKRINTKPKKE